MMMSLPLILSMLYVKVTVVPGPRKYKKGSSSVGGAVGGYFDWTHKISKLQ